MAAKNDQKKSAQIQRTDWGKTQGMASPSSFTR